MPLMDSMTEALARHQQTVLSCRRCGLCTGRHKAVPGVGATPCRLFVLGEGPGEHEDKSGLPFVGQAGELLDAMLDLLGLRADEVFISNTVRCRPPQNRVPRANEIKACWPFLMEEIRLSDPPFILCAGATGYEALTRRGFRSDAGHMQSWDGRSVMPTYHPAATFYTPALKIKIAAHLKILRFWMEL